MNRTSAKLIELVEEARRRLRRRVPRAGARWLTGAVALKRAAPAA